MWLGRRAEGRQSDFYCFSSAKRHQWLLKRGRRRRCLGSEHPLEPAPHPWHHTRSPSTPAQAPAPCRALKSAIFYLYIRGNSAALCTHQGINVFSKSAPSIHSSLFSLKSYPCADNRIRHYLWLKYKTIKSKALFLDRRRINHLILNKYQALFSKTSHAPFTEVNKEAAVSQIFNISLSTDCRSHPWTGVLIIICKWKILRHRISVN